MLSDQKLRQVSEKYQHIQEQLEEQVLGDAIESPLSNVFLGRNERDVLSPQRSSRDAIGSSLCRSSRLPSPETSINPILPSVVSKTRASTPYPRRRPSFITTSPTFSLARKSKVNCFPNYSHEKVERSKRMNKPLNSPKDSNLSENIQLSTTLPIIVSENNKIKEVHASSNSPPSSKYSSTFPTTQNAQTTNWSMVKAALVTRYSRAPYNRFSCRRSI